MKGLKITAEKTDARVKYGNILDILSSVLFMTGVIKIIFSGFPSISDSWWIYAIVSACSICLLLPMFKRKERDWIMILGFVLLCILFFVNRSQCSVGLGILGNDVLDYMTGKTGKIFLAFPESSSRGQYIIPVFVISVLALIICRSISTKVIFPCLVITGLCCIGCIIGLFFVDYGIVILMVGMLLLMAGSSCTHGNMGESVITFLIMSAFLTVCCFIIMLFCSRYDNYISFDSKINELSLKLHKLKYDSGINAMPEGNLVNMKPFSKSGDVSLIVNLENPEKLYLRGRTGEVYTGISWENFDDKVYREGEELFYWLHKSGFYGQSIISNVTALMQERSEAQIIQIENKNACKEQVYIPYALADNSLLMENVIGDDRTYAETDIITTRYLPGSLPQWYQMALWISENQKKPKVSDYLKKEESYRDFVYKNNLQLTNTVVGVFENMFKNEGNGERNLSEILELVKDTLEKKLTYDEAVFTYNGRNDFVKFVLEQNKRGYSPHYATIATLMLRYMGVPARYVEGYYLSGEEADKYKDGEEIILTEGHAHAWTEYYLDGIGWIPFEVTPGYIDEEEWEAASIVIADGKGSGAGKQFTQSNLRYKPPRLPENKDSLPELQSAFRFEVKHFINFLIIIVILLLLFLALWVMKKYFRLKQFWRYIRQIDNRQAVAELYGYGMMLIRLFEIPVLSEYDDLAARINERARFGKLDIKDEELRIVEKFVQEVIGYCKVNCNIRQKIRYHFILWLY